MCKIELAKNIENRLAELYENAKAPSTIRAYATDIFRFRMYCSRVEAGWMPASPETVAEYIVHLFDIGMAPSTIKRQLTAISQAHKSEGYAPPVNYYVRQIERSLHKKSEHITQKAKPITLGILTRIIESIPKNFIGLRDRALLLLGWAAALRRSELVAIQRSDITDHPKGIMLEIRHSKTDQLGLGRSIPVPFCVDSPLCPVKAISEWMTRASIKHGPVFRQIGPYARELIWTTSDKALSARYVSSLIKSYVAKAGYDPTGYSGHSLRAGFVTAAAEARIPEFDIMKISGHVSPTVMRGYIREGTLFHDPALIRIIQNSSSGSTS